MYGVSFVLPDLLIPIFLLSVNRPPFHARLNFGVFLLLPNLPADWLKCQIFKVSAHPGLIYLIHF